MPTGAFVAVIEPILGWVATRVPKSIIWVMVVGFMPNVAGLFGILFIKRIPENKWALLGCTWLQFIFGVDNLLSWNLTASNFAGHSKKSLVNGLVFCFFGAGNVIGPHLFFPSQAPVYRSAIIGLIVSFGISVC